MLIYAADVPTAADWLEAWSTFGAAVFSAGAIVVAFLVWRHDQRLRREDALAAEAAQARLVVARVTHAMGSPTEGWLGVAVVVNNNSQSQILTIDVAASSRYAVYNQGHRHITHIRGDAEAPAEIRFPRANPWPFVDDPTIDLLAYNTSFVISYVDSAGLRWKRSNEEDPRPERDLVRVVTIGIIVGEYFRVRPLARLLTRRWESVKTRVLNHMDHRVAKRHGGDLASIAILSEDPDRKRRN